MKSSISQRRYIFAFLGILVSLLLLLSLVSYSPADQSIAHLPLLDLFKPFTFDSAHDQLVEKTNNLLGPLGAVISYWLYNSTVGLTILFLPVLVFLWSIHIIKRSSSGRIWIITNYGMAYMLLVSIFLGTVQRIYENTYSATEISGSVGDFLSQAFIKIMGLTGAILLLGAALLILTIYAAKIDLQSVIDWCVKLAGKGKNIVNRRDEILKKPRSSGGTPVEDQMPDEATEVDVPERKVEISIRSTDDDENLEESLPERFRKKEKTEGERKNIKTFGDTTRDEEGENRDKDRTIILDPNTLKTSSIGKDLEISIKERIEEKESEIISPIIHDISDEEIEYIPPSIELLDLARGAEKVDDAELKANADLLQAKLSDFEVAIDSVTVTPGPVVTLYELVPATGVKISRIQSLEDDIALALKAKGIRIIAPIPGKGTVGVEIPNHRPALVNIRSAISSSKFRESNAQLPIILGKTISGEVFVDDLTKMPHLLIAGATGSGKSVGINTIICSLLYSKHPSDVKFVIIDPKKIELAFYRRLKNHYLAISPDIEKEEIITSAVNSVNILRSAELEMEKRYDRLASAGVRNIQDYNVRVADGRLSDTPEIKHRKMPYLIIIIDELADLMITAAREVEEPIARLAQLARAVGIHLIVATQRPSVDVITGVIKANFSARIAFQVSSKIDSRTILDMNGADQLLGAGDMLYLPSTSPKPMRIQNAFISSDEVERINDHIGKQKGYSQLYHLPSIYEKKKNGGRGNEVSTDELFAEAARIIVRHQQGSVSLLQRRLKVGYSRAARLVDELESAGIVGPFDGSKAREVLVETDTELDMILKNLGIQG